MRVAETDQYKSCINLPILVNAHLRTAPKKTGKFTGFQTWSQWFTLKTEIDARIWGSVYTLMHSSPLTAVPRLPTTTQIASPLLLPFSLGKMSSSLTDSQSKWCPSFLNITFFLKLLTFLFGTVFFSTRISSLDFSVRFSQYEQFPQWLLVKFRKEFFHSS